MICTAIKSKIIASNIQYQSCGDIAHIRPNQIHNLPGRLEKHSGNSIYRSCCLSGSRAYDKRAPEYFIAFDEIPFGILMLCSCIKLIVLFIPDITQQKDSPPPLHFHSPSFAAHQSHTKTFGMGTRVFFDLNAIFDPKSHSCSSIEVRLKKEIGQQNDKSTWLACKYYEWMKKWRNGNDAMNPVTFVIPTDWISMIRV